VLVLEDIGIADLTRPSSLTLHYIVIYGTPITIKNTLQYYKSH